MSDKVNRQRNLVIKNTLVLYVRMFITMGVSLYTSRLVLNALGVVDFGIYNVVGGVVGMFGFLNVAMASSTQRFLNYELGKGNISQLNKVFNASVTIHAIIAIFILLLAETIGLWFLNNRLEIPDDKINAANWVFQFAVLSSMISLVQVPLLATIIAYERMKVYAYISIVEAILKLLVALILTWVLWEKLKTYAILMCSVVFIIFSV
uniref:MATE family efflux transporter n=1 Tax=Coprobacter fastidiosus TaxID=1099853 RepID=UPI00307CF11C